ncbi:MAG: DUF881 domain-containing protein [Candidatus Gracilibacteria bacterium]
MTMTTRLSIIFVLLGVTIGVFFAAQFRTDVPLDSAYPADQYVARQNLIKDYIDEQGVLRNQIANLNKQIDEQQKKNEAVLSKTKLSHLDDLKASAGLTTVVGRGIQIDLSDSPGANRESVGVIPEALVQAADIRDIVNLLRTGHSDAISINGQRVLATTPITAVGGNILVNNSYIAPPFEIVAAGDENFLYQRLKDPAILPELKKRASNFKLQFNLTLKSHVNIPAYNGDFRLKYVTTPES